MGATAPRAPNRLLSIFMAGIDYDPALLVYSSSSARGGSLAARFPIRGQDVRAGRHPEPGGAGPACPRPIPGPPRYSPSARRSAASSLAQVSVLGWSGPSTLRKRARCPRPVPARPASTRARAGRAARFWTEMRTSGGRHPEPGGAGPGCFIEFPGRWMTEHAQVTGEVAGRAERGGIVGA